MLENLKRKFQAIQSYWHQVPRKWHEEKHTRYRVAVAAMALAGYAWLLAFPLLGLYAVTALVFGEWAPSSTAFQINLALFLAGGAATVRLARARFALPEGEPVILAESPRLFGHIDAIQRELQTAPVHEVRVTPEFEVQLVRTPKTGFPFVSRNTLLIGMPVLLCMTETQLKAWMASQMGEMSSQHAHLTSWISQMRKTWIQYRNHFARPRTLNNLLFGHFFNVYTRLFNRFTAPLMYDHHFVQDRYALRMLGDEATIDWMTMQAIMARFLEEDYWPSVYHVAEKAPEPNINPFRNLGVLLSRRLNDNDAKRWLREAYSRSPAGTASPTLRQRLQAIAAGEPAYEGPPAVSAAETLLADVLNEFLARIDKAWQERERETWQLRYQKSCAERERLDQLREQSGTEALTGRKAMEYAALVKRHGTTEEAREAYQRILQANPDDAQIVYGVGKFFVALGEERGIKLLERAMEMDKHFVVPACRLISEFRNRSGATPHFPAREGQTIKRRAG